MIACLVRFVIRTDSAGRPSDSRAVSGFSWIGMRDENMPAMRSVKSRPDSSAQDMTFGSQDLVRPVPGLLRHGSVWLLDLGLRE